MRKTEVDYHIIQKRKIRKADSDINQSDIDITDEPKTSFAERARRCFGSITGKMIAGFLFLTCPRMSEKKRMIRLSGWYYAHRGLFDNEGEAPENSMPAFMLAAEKGFGIELDVQLTKDLVPVVFHDNNLVRACGVDVKIKELTYRELQEYCLFHSQQKIPLFREVLKQVNGKVPLIIELKSGYKDFRLCELVTEQVKRYRGRYCLESFQPFILAWFRKKEPSFLRGQLSDNFIKSGEKGSRILFFFAQNLLCNFIGRPDFIAYNHHYKDNFCLQFCRKVYHVPMAAWTIRSMEELSANRKFFDIMIFDHFQPEENGLV